MGKNFQMIAVTNELRERWQSLRDVLWLILFHSILPRHARDASPRSILLSELSHSFMKPLVTPLLFSVPLSDPLSSRGVVRVRTCRGRERPLDTCATLRNSLAARIANLIVHAWVRLDRGDRRARPAL